MLQTAAQFPLSAISHPFYLSLQNYPLTTAVPEGYFKWASIILITRCNKQTQRCANYSSWHIRLQRRINLSYDTYTVPLILLCHVMCHFRLSNHSVTMQQQKKISLPSHSLHIICATSSFADLCSTWLESVLLKRERKLKAKTRMHKHTKTRQSRGRATGLCFLFLMQ